MRKVAIVVVGALVLCLPLLADRATQTTVTRSGQVFEHETQRGETVDVIIELRQPPRIAALQSVNAAKTFATLFDRLERDLQRLTSRGDGGVATNAAASPMLRLKYSVTFSGASATIATDSMAAVSALPYVKRVHLDRIYKATLQQSVPQIRAPQAWTHHGNRGRGATVAVIDTGIDYRHASLGGGFGPAARVIGGWDFVNDDADPLDDAGHGTHVAGIIGGNGGGITGVAPEVTFLAYKVLNAQGSGVTSDVLAAVERAADPNGDDDPSDRADVVNMSLGGAGSADDPLSTAVENAIAAGAVFCIATGNAGDFYTVSSPATAPSAISVGAVDRDGAVAVFSSKGPSGSIAALKPEVAAPGVGIVSARMGGGVVAHNGTSMATPHVAGVAALVRAVHPEWTPADVKSAIVNSATPLGDEVMAVGAGRVDALAATSSVVLASPSVLDFGPADPGTPIWLPLSQSVTLTNRSSAAMTLQVSFSGVRAGVTLTAEPSSLTLAAGESKTTLVSLSVDNALVPSPEEGSLAFGGQMVAQDSATYIHLPWAFVKASRAVLSTASSEPYYVVLASARRAAQMFIEPGAHSANVLLPAGTYDVLVRRGGSLDPAKPALLILLEQQRVDGQTTIEFSPEMATVSIDLQATDEKGVSLDHQVEGWWQCHNEEYLVFPSDSFLALAGDVHMTTTYHVKPFSDRFTLLPAQECLNLDLRIAYAANHEPLRGASSSVTRTINATDWTTVPFRYTLPRDAADAHVQLIPDFFWRGANWTIRFGQPKPRLQVDGEQWSGTMFLTPEHLPDMGYSVDSTLLADFPGIELPFQLRAIDGPNLRVVDGKVTDSQYLTPTGAAYGADSGYVFRLGEGPMYPETFVDHEDGQFFHSCRWIGALGEQRDLDSIRTEEKLLNESGTVIDAGPQVSNDPLTPGKYRYVGTSPVKVEGRAGRGTVAVDFDMRRADPLPPTLSSLRIESEGKPSVSQLSVGDEATLVFSVFDRYPHPTKPGSKRRAIAGDGVQAWARATGATEWIALPLSIAAIDDGEFEDVGHVTTGTVFRAELPSVLRERRGGVELRIVGRDLESNGFDYVLAPAFMVGANRRRSAAH